jgi:hypothetical protein
MVALVHCSLLGQTCTELDGRNWAIGSLADLAIGRFVIGGVVICDWAN